MTEIRRTEDANEELDSGMQESSLNHWRERIMSDKDWAISFYSERNREFDNLKNWYYKLHYESDMINSLNSSISDSALGDMPSSSENEHLSIINLPTDIVDTALTVIMNEMPHIEVLSNRESKSALDKQNRTERVLVGTYYINTQVQGVDPIVDAAMNMILYGWGALRALWDIDREAELDEADGFVADWMFPIVVQSISPYLVLPVPGGRYERWRAVIYSCHRAKAEIEEEWGVTINPKRNEDNKVIAEYFDDTEIEYIDYWCWKGTEIWHAVMADGEFIKEPAHMEEYDSLPYEIFFCREGPDKTRGENMGLSFLYTVLEPVKEMELLANRELRAIELYADPPLVTVKNPDSPSIPVETGPGARIELDQGESALYLQWQGNPPEVRAAKEFWSRLAQQFSFPDIFSGLVGGTSGLDTIALQQSGMAKVFTPRRNLERALENLNTKIIRLFQKRRPTKSLKVRGTRVEADEEHTFAFDIKGADTKGCEYTKVTIRARFPQEELRNAAIAQGLVASDMYSLRDAMSKFLYVQDPERMMRRRQEEKAEQDPAWMQFHVKNLLASPPQSPVGKVLAEGQGDVPSVAQMMPTDATQLPEPPLEESGAGGPLGPESAALNTIAGGGLVRPGSTDNPLTAIMNQAGEVNG